MTSKRIFMIGQSQNSSLNKQVIEEARKFRDILILNFEEHYLNLTYKGYGMLEYVNKYCKNLKCVQKTDTDATVNVKGLEKLCNALPENEHIITGMVWHKLGVSRDPNGKHYIPPYVYPNEYYPDFATGTAYLLSGYHIAQRMLDSLRNNTPFFTSGNFRHVNEDALFTGMVRESARIKLQDIGGYMCCIKSHGSLIKSNTE
uniref:Hexosyltransferase n=1 Tax=Acrobeloides nanus TaxID=290746 RepID=A0A914CBM8_9BILA